MGALLVVVVIVDKYLKPLKHTQYPHESSCVLLTAVRPQVDCVIICLKCVMRFQEIIHYVSIHVDPDYVPWERIYADGRF